jgi:hypothetical protein
MYGRPKFLDSEYFYYDKNDRPALKDGAPKALVDELNEFLDFHYGEETGEN